MAIDRLYDAFVHETGQDHFDHFDGCLIGHTLAVDELGFDTELIEHFVDHWPAAMHDYGLHPDLLHEHDVAREIIHRLVRAHGVAAKFDHDGRALVALQIGERLGKGAGGGDPVSVHVLLLHIERPKMGFDLLSPAPVCGASVYQVKVAITARSVSTPQPFSDEVTISSG